MAERHIGRSDRLGGIGGAAFSAPICQSAYGGAAYAPPYILVPCVDGLVALRVASGAAFRIAWRFSGIHAGPPIVAGGAVWTLDLRTGRLYALRLGDGSQIFRSAGEPETHFAAPSSGLGMIFAPAETQVVAWQGV